MIVYCRKCETESVPRVRITFHPVPAFAGSHAAVPKYAFLLSAYCRDCGTWATNLAQDEATVADLTGSWLSPDPSDMSLADAFSRESPPPKIPAGMTEKRRALEAHGWELHDGFWSCGRYRLGSGTVEALPLADLVHSLKNPATTWPKNV